MISQSYYDRQIVKAFIHKQVARCASNNHYAFGIYLKNQRKIKLIDLIINDIFESNFRNNVAKIRTDPNSVIIDFGNGSRISVLVCRDVSNERGKRYHSLLTDNNFSDDELYKHIHPLFTGYYIECVRLNDYRVDVMDAIIE